MFAKVRPGPVIIAPDICFPDNAARLLHLATGRGEGRLGLTVPISDNAVPTHMIVAGAPGVAYTGPQTAYWDQDIGGNLTPARSQANSMFALQGATTTVECGKTFRQLLAGHGNSACTHSALLFSVKAVTRGKL